MMLIIGCVALTMFLLQGCGRGIATKTISTSVAALQKTSKQINMKISIWGNDAHKKMYDEMLAKYKEKNPNISTDVLVIPFVDYQQMISIMRASGQSPDIAWLSDIFIPQFLETNQLIDISDLSLDKTYDFDDINPISFDQVKKDGKYYGVAFSTPPALLYYNKNLFKENNLNLPITLAKEGRWNYDEFLKAAKTITNKDKGIYGVKLISNDWKNWYINIIDLVWGFGGDVFSKDMKTFTFNSTQGEQALQLYYDMMFKDEVHPKPGDQITFESGKLGMYANTLSYISTAKTIKDFEWDIAPLASGPKDSFTRTGFAAYVMFKVDNDPKSQEKHELFKYLTNKDQMSITAQYFVPSRKSILSSNAFKKLYPDNIQDSFQLTILDRLNTSKFATTPANFVKINPEVQIYFDMLYTNTITVKDALKKMEAAVTPLMK